jgi:hypothetical protein
MRKNRLFAAVFAMLVGLGLMVGTSVQAEAATWYSFPLNGEGCGSFFTNPCYVLYTGGYPGGIVRALGGLNEYEVLLQSASSSSGPYTTVASTYPHTSHTAYTPTVPAGKFSYFRACMKTISGGPTWCNPEGSIYLGD